MCVNSTTKKIESSGKTPHQKISIALPLKEEEQAKRFLTVTETAQATGLSTYFIRQGIRDGWIPYIRCGAKAMINYPKLIAVLDCNSETSHREGETA